jgi:hypothetical protein
LAFSRALAAIFAKKVSRQSGTCHRCILARFSSHSETRLPLDLCRRVEVRTGDIAELRHHRGSSPGAPIRSLV